jgi:hypothetical protein
MGSLPAATDVRCAAVRRAVRGSPALSLYLQMQLYLKFYFASKKRHSQHNRTAPRLAGVGRG